MMISPSRNKIITLIASLLIVSGCSKSSTDAVETHADQRESLPAAVEPSVQSDEERFSESKGAYGDQGAVASSVGVSAGRSPSEAFMPIEATYITNGAVNQRATDMIKSKSFDRLLTAFDAQNAGGKNELASAYRVALEETLAEMAGGRTLDRISCATEMCIATIRSDDESWYMPWRDGLQSKLKLPMQVAIHHKVNLGGGMTEYRLLFTTGENSEGGIMGGPPQPGG